jgi:hypothetical protein
VSSEYIKAVVADFLIGVIANSEGPQHFLSLYCSKDVDSDVISRDQANILVDACEVPRGPETRLRQVIGAAIQVAIPHFMVKSTKSEANSGVNLSAKKKT